MIWEIYKKESSYYVRGLQGSEEDKAFSRRIGCNPDRMLLSFSKYGEPDDPSSNKEMLSALYDLYQCNDEIKEDDRFVTPFGEFFCWSFHVSPIEEYNEIMRSMWCPEQLTVAEQKNLLDWEEMMNKVRVREVSA